MIAGGASRRIVVCADDFGIAPRSSKAILRLAEIRAISAITVLVDGESTAEHASGVRALSPEVTVGLHFSLTEKLQGHAFGTLGSLLLRTYVFRKIDRVRLLGEIGRQCDRFETLFGRPPDFVDGHEHVHQLPIIREVFTAAILARFHTRIAVRTTRSRVGRGVKASVIAALGGTALGTELCRLGIPANDDFAGVYDFSTRVPYAARMEKWLKDIADHGLIMCHPQLPDPMRSAPAREAEFAYLESAAWRDLRLRQNVSLIPFRAQSTARTS